MSDINVMNYKENELHLWDKKNKGAHIHGTLLHAGFFFVASRVSVFYVWTKEKENLACVPCFWIKLNYFMDMVMSPPAALCPAPQTLRLFFCFGLVLWGQKHFPKLIWEK